MSQHGVLQQRLRTLGEEVLNLLVKHDKQSSNLTKLSDPTYTGCEIPPLPVQALWLRQDYRPGSLRQTSRSYSRSHCRVSAEAHEHNQANNRTRHQDNQKNCHIENCRRDYCHHQDACSYARIRHYLDWMPKSWCYSTPCHIRHLTSIYRRRF